MWFITVMDDLYVQNEKWMEGLEECPRTAKGRVRYLRGNQSDWLVGYYPEKEQALKAVAQNYGNMHEFKYTFCCVEFIPPGLMNFDRPHDQHWFEWNDMVASWMPIERPKWSLRTLSQAF